MCEEMKSVVGRIARELDEGHDPQLDVRRGDPGRVLVDASRELDVLILGSRAYGPLRYVLLGSVSAEVMRAAHCPVLVLPRAAGLVNATETSRTPLAAHSGDEAAVSRFPKHRLWTSTDVEASAPT